MLTPEQLEKLEQLIRDIASGLYEIALKQVYIDASLRIVLIVFLFLMAIISISGFRIAYIKEQVYRNDYNSSNDPEIYNPARESSSYWETMGEIFMALSLLFGVGTAISLVLCSKFIVTAFLNPNWILIERLVGLVK